MMKGKQIFIGLGIFMLATIVLTSVMLIANMQILY